jgi:hypothetical protein
MSLPIGTYTFCIHYDKGDSGFWHYIRSQPETLTENDLTDLSFAHQVSFATEHPDEQRGRCGTPPLSTAGASAAGSPSSGGPVDWSGLPLRPVGFVNSGPYNATVMPWTYVPAGSTDFVPVPDVSTASFAPTGPGLWPNSSRFLSLPIGTYTWCMEWTDGRDENDDQYFDYYHWIDPREVTLDENDSTDLTFAEEVTFNTEYATPGECDNPPYGVAGSASGAGGVQIIPGAGQVTIRLTWATTDDLDLHVTEPNGEEIWYQNRASDTGGALDVDANAGCSNTTTAPVENVFWTRGSAPLGEYRVRVHVYADCDDVPPVAFRLRIVVDGQVVFDATQTLEGQGDDFTFAFNRPVR